ncbi:MAG: zeta toxin family protein [Methanobrevibacter sp.]|nr:zeta toxin family protein [Methanobrevibacter sp.]
MLTITKNSGYVCVSNGTDFILLNDAVTDKVAYVMREFAAGKLKDSHGNIVTDKKQALAIAYSEAKKMNNEDIQWITVKGVHIPIKGGEDKYKAVKDFFKKVGYQSGGFGKSIKTNKYFSDVMSRVNESNKREIKQEDVISEFMYENKGVSKDAIEKAIKNAENYREKKTFVNDKGEKQYIDTQSINTYKDKEGNRKYTKERRALHKKILGKIMENAQNAKPKDGEAPTFTILGGRGGSGKSKLEGLAYDPKKVIKLDADEIKNMLPEYKGYNAWEVHEESSDIVKRALSIAKQKGLNVVLDGTMSGFSSAEKKIKDFESAGYNIDGFYMHLPREISAKRGLSRFMGKDGSGSGRYVPLGVMLNMKNNEENFQKLLPHFRRWAMWDNNVKMGEEPKLVQKSWN